MRPIPQCQREMIVAAKKRGEKAATIAQWVGVTESSVYNILRLYERTKSLSPKPFPGRESILTEDQLEQIRATVEAENDITLQELIEKLNLPIKKSRLSVILINMGFSFKKNSASQGTAKRRRREATRRLANATKKS